MSRILLIELRRSTVLWAALTMLASGTAMLYSARQRWTSGWMILALDQRWYLPFLAGIALAAGAAQGRRERRSRVEELFAGMPRPRFQQVVPVLIAYGISMVLAYAGATALAALWILGTAHYLPVGAFLGVVAVGAVAVLAGSWFGLAAGRLLPYVVTAPALAILSLASPLAVPGREGWVSALLFPAHGLGSGTDFDTIQARFSIGQLLYLTGLAAGAALLFARTRWPALLPPLLGTALAALVLQGGAAFVRDPIDPVARSLVCTPDAPTVCVARVHSGVLDEVAPPARAALATLSRLPGAPTRAVEAGLVPRSADTLLIPLAIDDNGHALGTGRLAENLGVLPFPCPADSPGPDTTVVDAASAWLLGTPDASAQAHELSKLSDQEAAARVAAVRRAVLTCSRATY
ncbi:hypothetical protein JIG36_23685 [Actinoplanes sp. LDG1-06]|uniref:ABC transporter permease n=1 Tax=Paractinoplanes ovalisporus TaxID=2810368 RepID=A0ABS2AFH4_9ACTN|nr:hypothetical protein [Actinoplanes ovalisporus]MBM2618562.1 hypothetical protein [Actinoplanes ovalisporus]